MLEVQLTGNPVEDKSLILSAMFFPSDQAEQDSLYALIYAQELLRGASTDDEVILPYGVLKQLLVHNGKGDAEKRKGEAVKKGVVAGDILASLYLMDVIGIEEPSLNKAVFVAQRFAEDTGTYNNGDRMYPSEGAIKKIWGEFKAVSHLWAAYRLNTAYPFTEPGTEFSGGLVALASVGESIRKWAVSFVSQKRQKRNIFAADDFLSIKSDYLLPIMRLKPVTPPDRLVTYLADYRADRTGA